MPRIHPVDPDHADPAARSLLDGARRTMGMIPNLLKGLAHSPAALDAYMSLSAALSRGTLCPKLREQIALAAAGANECEYCAAAHSAIGKGLDLDDAELRRNLASASTDGTTAAALSFVRTLIERRGNVSDADVQAVRDAGFSDAAIAEIVGLVALNTFTNYFNGVAQTEIDFPRVEMCAA